MESPTRIWLLSPVYHDSAAYRILHARINDCLDADADLAGLERRFIVVDDSAGADLGLRLAAAELGFTLVTPPFNLGHQRALVYGLRALAGEIDEADLVVTLDADGEDRPEDIPRLVMPVLQQGAERSVALALRAKRREVLSFRAFYIVYRVVFRMLTGKVVRSGNFAAYRGWLSKRVLGHHYFDLCYSSALTSLDLATVYVPCDRGARYAGQSRMGLSRLMLHGLSMLMPFTDRIIIRALIGFASTIALCVVAAVAVVAVKLFTDMAIPGWGTSTLLGLAVLSVLASGNLVVLLVVFAQARGASLGGIEIGVHDSARSAP